MFDWWSYLTEPLGYAFMVRGLTAALIVGTVCAVIGTYIVLRGMALFGHALAHGRRPSDGRPSQRPRSVVWKVEGASISARLMSG